MKVRLIYLGRVTEGTAGMDVCGHLDSIIARHPSDGMIIDPYIEGAAFTL